MAISPPSDTSNDQPRLRLWTREEYHRAAELGLIRPDEKLELIEGEIIQKVSPQNAPHSTAIRKVARALESAFGPKNASRRPRIRCS
jgi:Uma2 family endonuclease